MSVSIGMTIAVTMMLALMSTAQAQPISNDAFDRLYAKQAEYCLLGSGVSKAYVRRTAPLCRMYSRQLERVRHRCESRLPENSHACTQLRRFYILTQYPIPDPRK